MRAEYSRSRVPIEGGESGAFEVALRARVRRERTECEQVIDLSDYAIPTQTHVQGKIAIAVAFKTITSS